MSPHLLTPARAPVFVAPAPTAARLAAAAGLQLASHLLARLARRLAAAPTAPAAAAAATARPPAELEFHAEAGAPEGALYADGVLVAVLPGVTRL